MKIIDLFAGCGGLSLGFKKHNFRVIGYVDWEKSCIDTLKINFGKDKRALFIIEDLRFSFNSTKNRSRKLINYSLENNLDGIIGGPPCQSYSIAGRVRDPGKMKNDYRNFLFESYVEWLNQLRPKFFVFENVAGMLSAKPKGPPIVELVSKSFNLIDYSIPKLNKDIVFDLAKLGGSQNRKRVIIFGVDKKSFDDHEERVKNFYENLEKQFSKPKTVFDAIGDLEKLIPLSKAEARASHNSSKNDILHRVRFHNKRDMKIFKLLAEDLQKNNPKYSTTHSIKSLYGKLVGRKSNVHKYYVLRWNQQSNLIPAHLYKDGLRHIHPDPSQSRSITMREAARLQNFPDNFIFEKSQSDIFKMIGNAVSPLMAEKIAFAVKNSMK